MRSPPCPSRPPGRLLCVLRVLCDSQNTLPPGRVLCVLRVLCDSQNTQAVLPAAARRPSLCLSVFSVVSVFFVICGSPASCSLCTFVVLCVLRVFPKNLPHSPSGLIRRALAARSPISPCRRKAPNLPRPSANQPISSKRGAAAPFCCRGNLKTGQLYKTKLDC